MNNMSFSFSSKASTLERLTARLSLLRLCDQVIVPAKEWQALPGEIVNQVLERFSDAKLAIRSSAVAEDTLENSFAGAHLSITNVNSSAARISMAINDVFASYTQPHADDQVLIQPMVERVAISGVVLTRDLDTGSPFYVINYDDFSGRTDTVTGGAESKTLLVHRSRPKALKSARFRKLIDGVIEIESITDTSNLDIEFCINGDDDIFVLQVRPLAARKRWTAPTDKIIDQSLSDIRSRIASGMNPIAGIAGKRTIYGEMPDWNPAEMIGTTPRPLALSLYKALITDRVWADARAHMGYRRVAEPLMKDFCGHPFIDVRLSFNSFLPAGLDQPFADDLVCYQLDLLANDLDLHDKIEFDIAVTCRDFNFARQRSRLKAAGFTANSLDGFEFAIDRVTQNALSAEDGSLRKLTTLTQDLEIASRDQPVNLGLKTTIEQIRRKGTLPFSKLARHGFIGVLFLKSLVARGVLTPEDEETFMRGIITVASEFVRDMQRASKGDIEQRDLLARYGHLRPGTYDILSWRYDERPDIYLGHAGPAAFEIPAAFQPSKKQMAGIARLNSEMGFHIEAGQLLNYIIEAIKAREQSKFSFTRAVSDMLSMLSAWGDKNGFSRDDLSFLAIDQLIGNIDVSALRDRISESRENFRLTKAIRLPHIIVEPSDIDVVRMPLGKPNYISSQSVTATARVLDGHTASDIDGCIVLIESADPGFDWIFSHPISGLITKYGGANSHMAIRCAEFGLPAAIGCGERRFSLLASAHIIELNCATHSVTPVSYRNSNFS